MDTNGLIMIIVVHDTTEEVKARMKGRPPNLAILKLYNFWESFPDTSFDSKRRGEQRVRGYFRRKEAYLKKQGKAIRKLMSIGK